MRFKFPYFNEDAKDKRAFSREAAILPYVNPFYRANLRDVVMLLSDSDPKKAARMMRHIGTLYRTYMDTRNEHLDPCKDVLSESFYLPGTNNNGYGTWHLNSVEKILRKIEGFDGIRVEKPTLFDINTSNKETNPFFFPYGTPEKHEGLPLIGNGMVNFAMRLTEPIDSIECFTVNALYGNIVPAEQS